ncbi:MAG: hypothetical protein ACR2QM_02980 [Longimicrobiales bacterium]
MPSKHIVRTALVVCAIAGLPFVVACASGNTEGGPRRTQGTITAEELAPLSTYGALEAVGRLRPRWLRPRGSSSSSLGQAPPVVVVDGNRLGGVEVLSNYAVTDIESIQFMSPSDATTRYGTDFAGGAILVALRKR